MFSKLLNDERGGVITTELVLVASVVVAIALAAMNGMKQSVQKEFNAFENSLSTNLVVQKLTTQVDSIEDTRMAEESVQVFGAIELLRMEKPIRE